MATQPYRSTPVFDETTLPKALRDKHRTKAGVWGVIRVLKGQLRLTWLEPPGTAMLSPDCPGLVLPEQTHFVAPIGAMQMQVDFHDTAPIIDGPLATAETGKP